MYFDTVDGATSKPSINSSPWIREAPQSEFSMLMRRINSRSSRSILGRLPSSDISTAKSFEIQHDANDELSRAERSGPRRASRATIEPSRPATLGHCPAVGREEASAVTPSSTAEKEVLGLKPTSDLK